MCGEVDKSFQVTSNRTIGKAALHSLRLLNWKRCKSAISWYRTHTHWPIWERFTGSQTLGIFGSFPSCCQMCYSAVRLTSIRQNVLLSYATANKAPPQTPPTRCVIVGRPVCDPLCHFNNSSHACLFTNIKAKQCVSQDNDDDDDDDGFRTGKQITTS